MWHHMWTVCEYAIEGDLKEFMLITGNEGNMRDQSKITRGFRNASLVGNEGIFNGYTR